MKKFLLKCIFPSIVLNQPPVHSTSWKYSTSWKSSLRMDEKPSNLKTVRYKKVHTEKTNTCSKTAVETLEQGGE